MRSKSYMYEESKAFQAELTLAKWPKRGRMLPWWRARKRARVAGENGQRRRLAFDNGLTGDSQKILFYRSFLCQAFIKFS